ncbi:MAG: OmpH family outer membrane protein [Acidobacteria bacterium]|nr:OmpH family outer membrane protein [Acidobacteriota bacterium]
MRTFRLIAASFIFAVIFAVSAFAQASAADGKVGLINTLAFDDKEGITKYISALNSLEGEFKQPQTDLNNSITKYQALKKELDTIQTTIQSGGKLPIPESEVQKKAGDLERLGLDIKRKQEDAKAQYQRRYQAIVGPIYQDIMKALQDFTIQKGYAVILDGAKLEEAGILMGFNGKFDITKEFITFYNARPASTATVVKPK